MASDKPETVCASGIRDAMQQTQQLQTIPRPWLSGAAMPSGGGPAVKAVRAPKEPRLCSICGLIQMYRGETKRPAPSADRKVTIWTFFKMRAYCINLDRRPDRLAHMTAEFARHDVPFERFAAIDAMDPAVAAAAGQCGATRLGPRLSVAAYACFQSHRAVWHRITDADEPYGMVFEDDVQLADGIASYLDTGWIPAGADVVRLETAGIRVHLDRRGLAAGPRQLKRLRGYHHGTGCYVIERTAAARLIDATASVHDPVDETMFSPTSWISRMLTIYQMVPAPVIQGDRDAVGTSEAWAKSSIVDRFADGRIAKAREGGMRRVARRLTAELSGGLWNWTYDVVTHG